VLGCHRQSFSEFSMHIMACCTFQRTIRIAALQGQFLSQYRASLQRHPFLSCWNFDCRMTTMPPVMPTGLPSCCQPLRLRRLELVVHFIVANLFGVSFANQEIGRHRRGGRPEALIRPLGQKFLEFWRPLTHG